MPTRPKANSRPPAEGMDAPKSFSPQTRDPDNVSAWDQLDKIANPEAQETEIDTEALVALARRSIRARQMRWRHLPTAMFGEPAWDMLLSLYVATASGTRATVSSLSSSSGSPPSTALRWIDYLEVQKFVTREACRTDRRMVFLDLTETARESIEAYLKDLYEEKVATPKS